MSFFFCCYKIKGTTKTIAYVFMYTHTHTHMYTRTYTHTPFLEVGTEGLRRDICMLSRCHVQLFATPWTVQSVRLLCPWNSPGKNTGVGCHALFQGIFPTQGLNPCLSFLLRWQVDSLPLGHLGSSRVKYQGNSTFFLETKNFKLRKFNLLKQSKFPDGIFPFSSYF